MVVMNIDIVAHDLELTPALKEYINMRLSGVDKFLGRIGEGSDLYMQVEVARITRHHRKGNVFSAKAVFRVLGNDIRAEAEGEDARVVIDVLKDKIADEIKKFKEKKEEK